VNNAILGNIGARVKRVRMGKGLNQATFAKKVGLSGPTVVSKYEKGQREPDIKSLIQIAKLGNKSLDWLLTGKTTSTQKDVDKKLGKLTAQLERIYHEGDSKTISGVQVVLDLADPGKTKRKKG
jgi:transcriptional regulator with XRE-family HTH domain